MRLSDEEVFAFLDVQMHINPQETVPEQATLTFMGLGLVGHTVNSVILRAPLRLALAGSSLAVKGVRSSRPSQRHTIYQSSLSI